MAAITGPAKVKQLHALSTVDTNTITDPKHIVPVDSTIPVSGSTLKQTLPGFSFELIEISTRN